MSPSASGASRPLYRAATGFMGVKLIPVKRVIREVAASFIPSPSKYIISTSEQRPIEFDLVFRLHSVRASGSE